MLYYFEIFNSSLASIWTFLKHYSKWKTVSIKFRKHFKRGNCLPILKISQDNPQNNFLHFLTSWKHFYNLTIFRGYPWNIFETEIRWIFVEYFGNIALWLLEFDRRSTFVFVVNSYIFNTKTTFPSRICEKIFSLKMFPKCSLDVRNSATLWEHSANIPGILRADWVGRFLVFNTVLEKL